MCLSRTINSIICIGGFPVNWHFMKILLISYLTVLISYIFFLEFAIRIPTIQFRKSCHLQLVQVRICHIAGVLPPVSDALNMPGTRESCILPFSAFHVIRYPHNVPGGRNFYLIFISYNSFVHRRTLFQKREWSSIYQKK